MPKKFTLGENERLKSRKQIGLMFSEGKSFVLFPFKVYYRQSAPKAIGSNRQYETQKLEPKTQNLKHKSPLQFGIGVSGKLFPRAVDRNQIKRVTKEAYRVQKSALEEKLLKLNCRVDIFFVY